MKISEISPPNVSMYCDHKDEYREHLQKLRSISSLILEVHDTILCVVDDAQSYDCGNRCRPKSISGNQQKILFALEHQDQSALSVAEIYEILCDLGIPIARPNVSTEVGKLQEKLGITKIGARLQLKDLFTISQHARQALLASLLEPAIMCAMCPDSHKTPSAEIKPLRQLQQKIIAACIHAQNTRGALTKRGHIRDIFTEIFVSQKINSQEYFFSTVQTTFGRITNNKELLFWQDEQVHISQTGYERFYYTLSQFRTMLQELEAQLWYNGQEYRFSPT